MLFARTKAALSGRYLIVGLVRIVPRYVKGSEERGYYLIDSREGNLIRLEFDPQLSHLFEETDEPIFLLGQYTGSRKDSQVGLECLVFSVESRIGDVSGHRSEILESPMFEGV